MSIYAIVLVLIGVSIGSYQIGHQRALTWPLTGTFSRPRTARVPLVVSRLAAHTGFVFALMRIRFDGAGWFVGLAVVLFVFALVALLVGLQSPDSLLWTGQQVTGTEQ